MTIDKSEESIIIMLYYVINQFNIGPTVTILCDDINIQPNVHLHYVNFACTLCADYQQHDNDSV